ncbi:hypothetical protein [Algibacillus agarilyticus]|uniref:hypothetical protein n=1 Tax=Algibacillus agarilyticus TaxID=2234133 RepID=UPI000DD0B614|nr:hypothetical protein [Algibacillus agarilyticus]
MSYLTQYQTSILQQIGIKLYAGSQPEFENTALSEQPLVQSTTHIEQTPSKQDSNKLSGPALLKQMLANKTTQTDLKQTDLPTPAAKLSEDATPKIHVNPPKADVVAPAKDKMLKVDGLNMADVQWAISENPLIRTKAHLGALLIKHPALNTMSLSQNVFTAQDKKALWHLLSSLSHV